MPWKTIGWYGVIGALASIAWALSEWALGLAGRFDGLLAAFVGLAISVATITLALRRVRTEEQWLPIRRGVATGVLVSALAGVLTAGFLFAFGARLRVDLADRLAERAAATARAQGDSESEAAARAASVRNRAAPHMLAFSTLIGALLNGVVVSAVVTLVLNRRR